jgi:hypothetical protein
VSEITGISRDALLSGGAALNFEILAQHDATRFNGF